VRHGITGLSCFQFESMPLPMAVLLLSRTYAFSAERARQDNPIASSGISSDGVVVPGMLSTMATAPIAKATAFNAKLMNSLTLRFT
jgi:hypothetical protein